MTACIEAVCCIRESRPSPLGYSTHSVGPCSQVQVCPKMGTHRDVRRSSPCGPWLTTRDARSVVQPVGACPQPLTGAGPPRKERSVGHTYTCKAGNNEMALRGGGAHTPCQTVSHGAGPAGCRHGAAQRAWRSRSPADPLCRAGPQRGGRDSGARRGHGASVRARG